MKPQTPFGNNPHAGPVTYQRMFDIALRNRDAVAAGALAQAVAKGEVTTMPIPPHRETQLRKPYG